MPPRGTNRGKRPARDQAPLSIPWDHLDGTHFTEPHLMFHAGDNITVTKFRDDSRYQACRYDGEVWNDTNKSLYNSHLRINFQPTRFLDPFALREMGIYSSVTQMLGRIGLGSLPFTYYPLYDELALQFFSSVELHHEEGFLANPNRAVLSFAARGVLYKAHVTDIYRAYGFSTDRTAKNLPAKGSLDFWKKIGSPTVSASRECKITTIRSPAIRIVAKVIGNLLMGKEEAGSLSLPETVLLHYGLSRDLDAYIYPGGSPFPSTLDTSIGYMFLQMLLEKKTRGLNMKKQKTEATGSLLTPIFRVAGVPLDAEPCTDTKAYMDEAFLHYTKILVGQGFVYQYTRADGVLRCVRLPVEGLMSPDTPEGLGFAVPQELQMDIPPSTTTHRPRPRSRTQAPVPPPAPAQDSLLGFDPHAAEYDFESPPAGASIEDRLDIMHRNQKREHSFNRKIWEVVSRWICGGGSQSRDRRREEASSSQPAATDQGHESEDDEDAEDAEDTEEDLEQQRPRHRTRRE